MAGDWIKMRGNLWDDPRVARLCDITDANEAAVVGGLYWLWATADQHTQDGILPGLSLRSIDRKTGIARFGDALKEIGWITDDQDGVRIVRFEEHNGASAKKRAITAKRVANHRSNADVTQEALQSEDAGVTGALAREREREREDKKKEREPRAARLPRPDDVSEATWNDWLALRRSKKAPVTETVLKGARAEAQKAQMPLEAFLQVWCTRGSQGLQAEWLKPEERASRAIAVQQAPRHYDDAEETRRRLDQAHANTAPPSPEIKARIAQALAGKVLQ